MTRVVKSEEEKDAAALAAKNSLAAFHKSTELEQFYRFIHENGLRKEAFSALEYVAHRIALPEKKKKWSKRAKKS